MDCNTSHLSAPGADMFLAIDISISMLIATSFLVPYFVRTPESPWSCWVSDTSKKFYVIIINSSKNVIELTSTYS
jgi:hypothetical protein